jgi:erythromycin esterase-like protein
MIQRRHAAPSPGDAREAVRRAALPLTGHAADYDALVERVGDASVVLLGEATHGTHEFYHERARITQRLVEEKGFTVVAVEADWPDAYRVNRWVRGLGRDGSAAEALDDFRRFPAWMWRNAEVLNFVDWLREYNDSLVAGHPRTGFYGLDLYSMFESIGAVLRYLDRVDPEGARRARQRYACFDFAGEDAQAYGYAAETGLAPHCTDEAVAQLVELRRLAAERLARDGRGDEDEAFYAEQNARLIADAEAYYRSMFGAPANSWNLRDLHMAGTLDALLEHFTARRGRRARAVVWAHNSHVGDARATQMGREGEWTLGQLVRERRGDDCVLVGFTTYTGTVTAASDWDAPYEEKRVVPALEGSYEALFHESGGGGFYLDLGAGTEAARALSEERLERAIGVIYLPRTERVSHYFRARLPGQLDAVIHLDETHAVEPLDRTSVRTGREESPETFPSAL